MKNYFAVLIIILLITAFSACKKNKTASATQKAKDETLLELKADHNWYYFANAQQKQGDGRQTELKKTDRLLNVPAQPKIPWTEAVRISCANNAADSNETIRAFAVVNRLGILCFEGENVTLGTDVNIFSNRTAQNLVFLNNTPIFSVYKSSFFNDSITLQTYKNDQSSHLFLILFDQNSKTSYPLLNCTNLTSQPASEITDFHWDGKNWQCCIKTIADSRNFFSYVQFSPSVPLSDLSPSTAQGKLFLQETDAESFRKTKEMLPYKTAPSRIKTLLSGFDNTKSFEIELKNAGGCSPRTYSNMLEQSGELHAKAIISQSWSAALFEDGTFFLEGALPGKHIIRGGKPVAMRLPKLPAGFVYSDFAISETTLYAAWEETEFYKTGRSGFLQVNLEKTLYSRIF